MKINERGLNDLIPELFTVYLYIYALMAGLDNELSPIGYQYAQFQ